MSSFSTTTATTSRRRQLVSIPGTLGKGSCKESTSGTFMVPGTGYSEQPRLVLSHRSHSRNFYVRSIRIVLRKVMYELSYLCAYNGSFKLNNHNINIFRNNVSICTHNPPASLNFQILIMMRTFLLTLLALNASAFAPQPSFVGRRAALSTSLFGIEDKVKEIICSQLGVDADKVVPAATFVDDLGADSLDTVELIMAIEEEFDCEIPEEEAANISTVQEVIDYVSKL